MTRSPSLLNWVHVRPNSTTALYCQISEQIRQAIALGELEPGAVLPSSRAFADDLCVSRITVLHAYEKLSNERLIETRPGSGTSVTNDRVLLDRLRRASARNFESEVPDESAKHTQTAVFGASTELAFRAGIPAFDAFPRALWTRLVSRAAARSDPNLLDYAHIGGYLPLRTEIARYLMASRGVDCGPTQVVVVGSVRAAIAAFCEILLKVGDRMAVEDPGYAVAREVISRRGREVVPVAVDEEGLRVGELISDCQQISGVYLTPAHHWPTGVALSQDRRQKLLDWAVAAQAWIIEDDYDSEFRFDSSPVASLYAQGSGRVIYCGTFSKSFAPSVRTAYVVVPQDRIEAFEKWSFYSGTEPSLHIQVALADLLAEGHFVRHIAQMRKLYARRRKHLRDAVQRHFGQRITFELPPGGLQAVATLPADVSARDFMQKAEAAGLTANDIRNTFVRRPAANVLHLGFAPVPETMMDDAVRRLEEATRELF